MIPHAATARCVNHFRRSEIGYLFAAGSVALGVN